LKGKGKNGLFLDVFPTSVTTQMVEKRKRRWGEPYTVTVRQVGGFKGEKEVGSRHVFLGGRYEREGREKVDATANWNASWPLN